MAKRRTRQRYLRLKEVAELLRLHPVTVCRYIRTGRLRATRLMPSRHLLIAEPDLATFMKAKA